MDTPAKALLQVNTKTLGNTFDIVKVILMIERSGDILHDLKAKALDDTLDEKLTETDAKLLC